MSFNENSRVKIPAILHLCRLGYQFIPLNTHGIGNHVRDMETNIITTIFSESIQKINPDLDADDVKRLYDQISLALDNEDLGHAFYKMLTAVSGTRLIDFDDIHNNSFHVLTEYTCKNGDDEFRPDITLLINGMPLVFIEVKKPNNQEGVLAERNRINDRFKNEKFRKFINATQLMIFSNNMEYDRESIEPVQGAFYATTSRTDALFHCFREEDPAGSHSRLLPESDETENLVLRATNLTSIKNAGEFITSKNPESPTHRILTSLVSRERLLMILRYGIAYSNEENGLEKHIMRYPQLFATKAIEKKLDSGVKKGIIWHTQGSGKTALAYYNVHYLTDYFAGKKIIPRFYFIVDRLDLMTQAKQEFTKRGLTVHTVDTREDLLKDFRKQIAFHNLSGNREITVVNIHKFENDPAVIRDNDYNLDIQRIYFLDEVHRSYNPKGSFLANLFSSDRNAIMIGLTGTPLLAKDRKSRDIFGDYIHKYYYNASIADGYTLRLIREGIETNYKIQLAEALREVEILKGDADRNVIYAHERFVEPMLDYIVDDFIKSRIRFNDHSIGAMVVCDSSDQAKKLYDLFVRKYNPDQKRIEKFRFGDFKCLEPKEEFLNYCNHDKRKLTASVILYNIGSKDFIRDEVRDFKAGKIDFLFVYNMLLTGFDAKRLKKLYIGRIVKDHNLLQTLTRVNRPYKTFRYGFVVDFADIRSEFDATNRAYFDELQNELGDELENFSSLFMTKEEIEAGIEEIKEKLFHYDLENAEIFSQQVTRIEDKKKVQEILNALETAKNLYNIIRAFGHTELLDKIDFKKLNILYNETSRHLNLLNLKESVQNNVDTTNLLNVALENIVFMFRKVSEEEMIIADQLKDMLRKTREGLGGNFDPKDPEFVSLYDELKRMFDKKNMDEISQEEMKENIDALQKMYDQITELNRKNSLLQAKYENDAKYARIHKRLLEKGSITQKESQLFEMLLTIKKETDDRIMNNHSMLDNEPYFSKLVGPIVIQGLEKNHIRVNPETVRFINNCIFTEYINEYMGRAG